MADGAVRILHLVVQFKDDWAQTQAVYDFCIQGPQKRVLECDSCHDAPAFQCTRKILVQYNLTGQNDFHCSMSNIRSEMLEVRLG